MPGRKVGVSVYPGLGIPLERQLGYLGQAAQCGVDKVFTSLLLPVTMGRDPTEVAGEVRALAARARELGMEIESDVSESVFAVFGIREEDLEPFVAMGLTGIRIDTGFSPERIAAMSRNPYGLRVGVNCAMTSPGDLERLLELGQRDRLTASFNFYPRPETGVSLRFVAAKARPFAEQGVPVIAFVPSQCARRLPLYAGLPTVEEHRYLSPERGARHLFATGVVSEVVVGDPFASEEELRRLVSVTQEEGVALAVRFRGDMTEAERQVVSCRHVVRPDEAAWAIRSDVGRKVVAEGLVVLPRPAEERPRLAVTVDNVNYGRYMGELQICLRDLPADPRVNVVGCVDSYDEPLLDLLGGGAVFRLYGV